MPTTTDPSGREGDKQTVSTAAICNHTPIGSIFFYRIMTTENGPDRWAFQQVPYKATFRCRRCIAKEKDYLLNEEGL